MEGDDQDIEKDTSSGHDFHTQASFYLSMSHSRHVLTLSEFYGPRDKVGLCDKLRGTYIDFVLCMCIRVYVGIRVYTRVWGYSWEYQHVFSRDEYRSFRNAQEEINLNMDRQHVECIGMLISMKLQSI